MPTGPQRRATPPRRWPRMLRAWPGILAVLALLAATTAVLAAGTQSASAALRTSGHTVGGKELAGHQPLQVRVTTSDRTDTVQQRAVPGTPVSVGPESVELPPPGDPSELRAEPATAALPYHATPAQGRSPPR